jgi:mannosyl-oligosaccharide glucosidase
MKVDTLSAVLFATCAALVAGDQQVLSENAKLSNESLLWGPYRPNLYFGVRPRIPKSLLTGLIWAKVDSFEGAQQGIKAPLRSLDYMLTLQTAFRHTCEQHEGMAGYGWEEYDVRQGGRQIVHDAGNRIDVTTEFVKFPGGEHGGGWGVRVRGTPRPDAPENLVTTVVLYTGMTGEGSIGVVNEPDDLGYEGSIKLTGSSKELGDFQIEVTEGPSTNKFPPNTHPSFADKPLDRTIVSSVQASEDVLWEGKALMFQALKPEVDAYIEKYGQDTAPPPWQVFTLPNDVKEGNLHYVQKVFVGAFEYDIIFSSGSAPVPTTSGDLTKAIKQTTQSFSERYTKLLAPKAPFTDPKYETFSKAMFSNLAGGIGYFYGDAVVDRSYASEYDEENENFWIEAEEARGRNQQKLEGPYELFSSIPSRPFFPRGFYWDEGFHR